MHPLFIVIQLMHHSFQVVRLKRIPHAFRFFGIAFGMALTFPIIAKAQDAVIAEQNTPVETVTISGNLLGTGLQNGLQKFAGSRTVMSESEIQDSGASSIEDALRHVPGVQVTDNSSSGGSSMSLNIGVRGLDGRFSPRSTVMVDGIPLAVAPYGQPQLSFAPVSLNSIDSIDVVRGGGAVRYGPQNVGGIINFNTRPIPNEPLVSDATVRYNSYAHGRNNQQYSAFIGGQHDDGIGMALLYSGRNGSGWREHSNEYFNDVSLKMRYEISPRSELYGKFGYYDARADVPGGLNTAQYAADPFQSQRTHDFWQGRRSSIDVGYINTLSADQEIEIKSYFNSSSRNSGLANNFDSNATTINLQPRNYNVFGIEPRFTQRLQRGEWRHDITVGYRFLREGSGEISVDQNLYNTGSVLKRSSENHSYANSVYIDDQIAWRQWRITPGLRYESVNINRYNNLNGFSDGETYHQPLPALAIAYIASPALTLFTNYNTSFGSVQFLELNLQDFDNKLEAEIAKTVELGARWNQDGLKWEATVFDLRFNNQIEFVGPFYINRGKTHHRGIETGVDYALDKINPALAGLSVYATYAYTKATLESAESGAKIGNDLPFYSRNVDTLGIRYQRDNWTYNLSSTHQSGQFADDANTVAENVDGTIGWIPGYRLWNVQVDWKSKSQPGLELSAGINNLTNASYFSRTTDTNAGKLAGASRMIYLQMQALF
jgi:Fe(3+) dicitrate transport protein